MAITAIFGGTFNPFHIGHYEMLRALDKQEYIDEILVMPDRVPPHKECDFLADNNIRIEMCKLATKDFRKANLCLVEFEREGKSYSYDTVMLLKKKNPEKKFAFVCGGDMLVYFDKWYKYDLLMKEVSFIVFKRTDTDEKEFYECVSRFRNMGMNITVMDEIIPSVSSTQIRGDFKNAESLLPKKIFNFLIEKGIYVE